MEKNGEKRDLLIINQVLNPKEYKIAFCKLVGALDYSKTHKYIAFAHRYWEGIRHFIIDLKQCQPIINLYKIKRLAHLIQEHSPGQLCWLAIITSNPTNTVFAHLVQKYLPNTHFNIKIFSTNEAASNWLNIYCTEISEYQPEKAKL